jgi:hypothetical protein
VSNLDTVLLNNDTNKILLFIKKNMTIEMNDKLLEICKIKDLHENGKISLEKFETIIKDK